MKKISLSLISLLAFIPKVAGAHCPLCTVGAGALAVLAASLGISSIVVGIFIGAFALALGLWLAPLIKKEFIPYQKQILALVVFLGTVIPVMPLVRDYAPLYISWWGEYGTTYTVNLFLFGVVIGAVIMFATPFISRKITALRGKTIPYQGISITLTLLVAASVVVQILS